MFSASLKSKCDRDVLCIMLLHPHTIHPCYRKHSFQSRWLFFLSDSIFSSSLERQQWRPAVDKTLQLHSYLPQRSYSPGLGAAMSRKPPNVQFMNLWLRFAFAYVILCCAMVGWERGQLSCCRPGKADSHASPQTILG